MRRRFPDLPPVWAAGAACASWALARWLPLAPLPREPGGLVMTAGLLLLVWASVWFRRKHTPIMPGERPEALIVEGPFRINRNPIYSAMTLLLLGWAMALGAASALLPALAFPVIVTFRFVRQEEAALRTAFGAEAEDYFAGTRRW